MNIEITIHCPELAALASALQAKASRSAVVKGGANAPGEPGTYRPPYSRTYAEAPASEAAAPVAPTTANAAPVAPLALVAPVAPIAPTAAPQYTLEQITKAGADLAQAGKMEELLALLTQYGVQAVTQLPPEQYGGFALALRGMGAAL